MAHEFMRSFTDTLPLQLTAAERAQACRGLIGLAAYLQGQYDTAGGGIYRDTGRARYQPPLWLYDEAASELVTVDHTLNFPVRASIGLLATAGEMLRGGSYYSLQSHAVVRFDQATPRAVVVADEVAPAEVASLRAYAEQKVLANAYRPVSSASFMGAMAASGIAVL